MNNTLISNFYEKYGYDAKFIFSAPGRSEIGGNHTDHQHGKVLAAALDIDCRAAAALNGKSEINVFSEGYGLNTVDLGDFSKHSEEVGSTTALIRGVAAAFARDGSVPGFDAYVRSDVAQGSGLSSSAAFEVLIATIINCLGGFGKTAPETARIAQYAENEYFGKPCGLMDQMASAVGGFITIDFRDPEQPVIKPVVFDFSGCGYALCIVNCGADHAGLTDEYAAITTELRSVCSFFGKDYLRDTDEQEFLNNLPRVRECCGDRAVMRALHIYEENRRVDRQCMALEGGDFGAFLELVRDSGLSSWRMLQNVTPAGYIEHQDMALALALAERLLGGRGACRVQGGGFAGTLEAFVPLADLKDFTASMEALLGKGCCKTVSIRSRGACLMEEL